MLEIVKAPNPVLSQKAKRIAKVDKPVLKLISQMQEAMESATDPVGVGLAAPQVGKSLQLFITKPNPKSKVLVFINPKIVKKENTRPSQTQKKEKEHKKLEGCLSLKDIWGEVSRFDSIWISYLDETGKKHHRKFSGFLATIVQHEIDHLNGILFPKRVLEQKGTLYKSEKDERGEDIFEEIKI
ncbi:MAG: peptide deformylase [Patescibacteria group bacterium]|nr:peptide deformylase [Patescibacteria group bacterium]